MKTSKVICFAIMLISASCAKFDKLVYDTSKRDAGTMLVVADISEKEKLHYELKYNCSNPKKDVSYQLLNVYIDSNSNDMDIPVEIIYNKFELIKNPPLFYIYEFAFRYNDNLYCCKGSKINLKDDVQHVEKVQKIEVVEDKDTRINMPFLSEQAKKYY